MEKCEERGEECADQGVTISGLAGATIDLSLFAKVKVEFKGAEDVKEECIKFKSKDGGKLESKMCSEDRAAICYAYCGKFILLAINRHSDDDICLN